MIRDSMIENNVAVKIIGADSNQNAIARDFTDDFWHIPRLNELPIAQLIKFCKTKNIKLIMPTPEEVISYFTKHKALLEKNDIFVMVSNEYSHKIAQDKLLFYKHLKRQNLPAIPTSEI